MYPGYAHHKENRITAVQKCSCNDFSGQISLPIKRFAPVGLPMRLISC